MAKEIQKEETFDDFFEKAASEGDGDSTDTKTSEEENVAKTHEDQDEVTKTVNKEDETIETEPKKEETVDIEHKYKTLQGMFEKMSHDFETYKKEQETKETKTENVDKETKDVTPKQEEVDEELEDYLKQYDFIAKNQSKLTEKVLKTVLSSFKNEIVKEINEKYDIPVKEVKALVETKLQDEYNEHIGAIHGAHKDYGKDYQKKDITEWIETLNGTKKKLYKELIESGDTDEVIELIDEFKKVKGIGIVDEDKEDTDDIKKQNKEKEQKLKSMETVESKKRAIGGDIKKADNYDDAFDEASRVSDKK
jgi:hypothetical protein